MFKTAYGEHERIATDPGSEYKDTFKMVIDKDGHKVLKPDGKEHIYAKIQEGLEETLIENILQRAALGDDTALNRIEGSYADITGAPKTLADAQQMILQITNDFNGLPVDIRREFDFSVEKFINEYGSDGWIKKMGFGQEQVIEAPAPVEEAKNE